MAPLSPSPKTLSGLPGNTAILSFDLETGTFTGRIHALGAVRSDTGESLEWRGKDDEDAEEALARLDDLAEGADCVLGHNIIQHDLRCLETAAPDLRLLELPVIDTLRLGPLAFPSHPYHALVKHYKSGGLQRLDPNNPRLDSELALRVFGQQYERFRQHDPHRLTAWHRLCTPEPGGRDRALDRMFSDLRDGAPRPADAEMPRALAGDFRGKTCRTAALRILQDGAWDRDGWPLAYALAWLSVAGGNSVPAPWIERQFPESVEIIADLRAAEACTSPECTWCRRWHDAPGLLKRWFGHDGFRPEPACDDGRPMQQAIVESALAGEHVLGVLPTGTGKSVCYQIPALTRYERTGALTVVISPLVALMSDQVDGLMKKGIGSAVTVNGLLNMLERRKALERVRTGDASMLITSPEQMRSPAVLRAIEQRQIGGWVLDEAHCLSRWGHDFRPDYLYVRNIIEMLAGRGPPPPLMCLTATAKPDVIRDIQDHYAVLSGRNGEEGPLPFFREFNGGAERPNLRYYVIRQRTDAGKFKGVFDLARGILRSAGPGGGVIVYCSTRMRCEELTAFLKQKDGQADEEGVRLAPEFFHAGLTPERKKVVQAGFIGGDIRVIVATNAFGMGIDKPDVRLVIHVDIPGSLENYLQEAGRAGRDGARADCVLFFSNDDVERQFRLSARSRLSRIEVNALLRALRRLEARKRKADPFHRNEVIATIGEILREDEEGSFARDRTVEDTRGRVAIAWLEQARFLSRTENEVRVFPSSLRVGSLVEAHRILNDAIRRDPRWRRQLLAVAAALIQADPTEGISTDDLMHEAGLTPNGVLKALHDLEEVGIAHNDASITVFVHHSVQNSSKNRLMTVAHIESALIDLLREVEPDLAPGAKTWLSLRVLAERLRQDGVADAIPDRLRRLVHSIAQDRRGEDGKVGSLAVSKLSADTLSLSLNYDWETVAATARYRRMAATCLIDHLVEKLPKGARGVDLLAVTTLGALEEALAGNLELKAAGPAGADADVLLLHRALLWLHEQDICRLNRGLTVFRPAMTIRLSRPQGKRSFTNDDFEGLKRHYEDKVRQIHTMEAYALTGIRDRETSGTDARRFARDYFKLEEQEFLGIWMPGKAREIARQMTRASWQAIVESLNNRSQRGIVTDSREETNVLVLAGPGSGKTRALVHRLAWLIRGRRENPRSIIALAYNRAAAIEIRQRLTALIGADGKGVDVLTFHALAMRITGASFLGRSPEQEEFGAVMRDATAILNGTGLPSDEADERRERLLAGFRWILVDEYQDVDEEQYQLLSALAGRRREDDSKLTLFAVGDDDQNIYAFKGASVEYIRRFEEDYGPNTSYLVENYRSSAHIVASANAVIARARNRMKNETPIEVNAGRRADPPGGRWEALDARLGRGRVQLLSAGRDARDYPAQAETAVRELERLRACDPENWRWERCAVIAREWKLLEPVRAYCEVAGVPSQTGIEEGSLFWKLRETQALVDRVQALRPAVLGAETLERIVSALPRRRQIKNPWIDLLERAVREFTEAELDGDRDAELPAPDFIDWLVDWGRQARREQKGLLLTTAHSAKGLEFDHVMVLDGGWLKGVRRNDPDGMDEARRLYYVAVTRARETLGLLRLGGGRKGGFFAGELVGLDGLLERKEFPPDQRTRAQDPRLGYRFYRCTPRDVRLSFAGGHPVEHPVHKALRGLSAGMSLRKPRGDEMILKARNGVPIARMAKSFRVPEGFRIRAVRVHAILKRTEEQSSPEYRAGLRCPSWEVLLPEFEYEPKAGAGAPSRPALQQRATRPRLPPGREPV